MKWFNKDKTQMINLDRVDAWFYSPGYTGENCAEKSSITLCVNGAQMESDGDEADELYKILKNEQDVLHS